jgi:hypothetical protein
VGPDFLALVCCYGVGLGLPLAVVQTLILRAACHFAGAEIPLVPRAFAAVLLSGALSVAVWFIVQGNMPETYGPNPDITGQYFAWLLTVLANAVLSAGLYALILRVSFLRGLRVWSIQLVLTLVAAVAFGCCCVVPVRWLVG